MINKFTIDDIAHICGIKSIKRRNGEVFAVCPFCGDKRGKFSYIIKKRNKENIYNCFACDSHGGAIDLFVNLSDKDYSMENGRKKAAKDIFQIINKDASFEEYRKGKEYIADVEESNKASDEYSSVVYYALLKELTLEEKHKEDLLRRGLTEEQIKRFRFKSTPKYTLKVCKALVEKGYNLEGVAGFYTNPKGQWDLNISGKGYFCPVFDGERNLITGFQIRVDNPKNGAKYLWLSSAGKEKGVSSGALSTFLPGRNDQIVIITEGILKATVVYSLLNGKISVLGVPGVKSIKGTEEFLSRFSGNAFVYEAYDMDKAIKTEDEKELEKTRRIKDAADKLTLLVNDFDIEVAPLIWDYDKDKFWKGNYKGLDDFLLSYDKKDVFLGYIVNKAQDALKIKSFFA